MSLTLKGKLSPFTGAVITHCLIADTQSRVYKSRKAYDKSSPDDNQRVTSEP